MIGYLRDNMIGLCFTHFFAFRRPECEYEDGNITEERAISIDNKEYVA